MRPPLDISTVLQALRRVLPETQPRVALHEPCFAGQEWIYVKECLDTGWVSSRGRFVDRFEARIAEYTGVKRAVAVVNGTSALHICLLLAGVQPGDEVLVPALTFVASANAVRYCGASPHFADSEFKTLGLDPEKLEAHLREIAVVRDGGCWNRMTGRPIRAAVPMHTYGHPVEIEALVEVCARFRITIIEDAAESLGSFYRGRHTGNWGLLSALSFNGNKVVTTGGGGAILTNDEELGRLAEHLTTTAREDHPWEITHDRVGYNYRLPNINAALGCAQLEELPRFLEQKRRLARRYQEAFAPVNGLAFFTEPEHADSNYWLNVILLDEREEGRRDELLETTNRNGIQTRPAWTLMHRLPMFKDCPRMDLGTAEGIARRLINLPSSALLGETRGTA